MRRTSSRRNPCSCGLAMPKPASPGASIFVSGLAQRYALLHAPKRRCFSSAGRGLFRRRATRARTLLAGCLLAAASPAAAQPYPPPVPLNFEVAVREGDWLLQCNNREDCQISGVATRDRGGAPFRALVTLSRIGTSDEAPLVNVALLDRLGSPPAIPQPVEGLQPLSARSAVIDAPPLAVRFPMEQPFAGQLLTEESGAALVAAVAAGAANLGRPGDALATLPRGNLDRLVALMRARQRDYVESGTAAEDAMVSRFYFEIRPAAPLPDDTEPPFARALCRGQRSGPAEIHALRQSGPSPRLVLIPCSRGTAALIVAPDGTVYRFDPPAPRFGRTRFTRREVFFDAESGILTLSDTAPRDASCGIYSNWGWTEDEGMLLLQTFGQALCRGIPRALWPNLFEQISWTTMP